MVVQRLVYTLKISFIKTYSMPINKVGTIWNVFEIVNGEIVDVNQVR